MRVTRDSHGGYRHLMFGGSVYKFREAHLLFLSPTTTPVLQTSKILAVPP